jgi:hypothetical protein
MARHKSASNAEQGAEHGAYLRRDQLHSELISVVTLLAVACVIVLPVFHGCYGILRHNTSATTWIAQAMLLVLSTAITIVVIIVTTVIVSLLYAICVYWKRRLLPDVFGSGHPSTRDIGNLVIWLKNNPKLKTSVKCKMESLFEDRMQDPLLLADEVLEGRSGQVEWEQLSTLELQLLLLEVDSLNYFVGNNAEHLTFLFGNFRTRGSKNEGPLTISIRKAHSHSQVTTTPMLNG